MQEKRSERKLRANIKKEFGAGSWNSEQGKIGRARI
jgi:hypothetical protein